MTDYAPAADTDAAHPARRGWWLHPLTVLALIFVPLWLLHYPLFHLPYYWDEAGYFVPAAHDIYTDGSFVPHSTLSNAHPPLTMIYLALAWKIFGFSELVTRSAMVLLASVALLALFQLARRVANLSVAVAAVVCTAIYSVFFAQSSIVQLDMLVAVLDLWALVLYLPKPDGTTPPGRRAACLVLLALATLAKETALLVPAVLGGWELLAWVFRKKPRVAAWFRIGPEHGLAWSFALALCALPLVGWFTYHHAKTGYTFGNPEYVRYNISSTLNFERIVEGFRERWEHITQYMNLWVLTLVGVLASFWPRKRPLAPGSAGFATRPVVALLVCLILAHAVALSIVGGAILVRYLLPVLPLLIFLWVAAIWRTGRFWLAGVACVCGAFAYRNFINPPYSFAWDSNLAYRDFILLHEDAARFVASGMPDARVLSSWPMTDELTTPMLGYVERPVRTVRIEDFQRATVEEAMKSGPAYDHFVIFSTWNGISVEDAQKLLGGRVVFSESRRRQWIAVLAADGGREGAPTH